MRSILKKLCILSFYFRLTMLTCVKDESAKQSCKEKSPLDKLTKNIESQRMEKCQSQEADHLVTSQGSSNGGSFKIV
jgi:hypothetical protein